MTSFVKRVDMGGLTIVCDGLRVGATKPGQAGTELTGTEIAYLDGLTPGTATASKALVLDASKGISTITSATVTTLTAPTIAGATTLSGAQTYTGGRIQAPVAVSNAAGYTVLAANSGALHAVPDQSQNITLTLPANVSGYVYEFMYSGAAADASNHIFTIPAGFYKGNVVHLDSDADAAGDEVVNVFSNGSSHVTLTLVTPGSYQIKLVSDGTNWFVSGYVSSATVPAFS